MKAKLLLDEGVLHLEGTPEEIAAYVGQVVPAPATTVATPARIDILPGASGIGFDSAEIGRFARVPDGARFKPPVGAGG